MTPNPSNSRNWMYVNNNGNINNDNTNNANGVAPELCMKTDVSENMQNGTGITNGDASHPNKMPDAIGAIFSFDNLYRSYEKCTKGVKWKYSTQNYMTNACCRIARLWKSIQNGVYEMHAVKVFEQKSRGVARTISALTFQDRITNKCICDNYLSPILTRSLIYDSGATLKGKGLSFAKRRILVHLRKHFRKYGCEGYVLKLDIRHYFASIDHDRLEIALSKKIKDPKVMKMVRHMIDSHKNGLGLGSQVSQISAMYYLNGLDHYVKERCKAKFYARYMDDMYILSPDERYLLSMKRKIAGYLRKLGLELNKSKSKIYELKKGFVFCKTRYVVKPTGKILRLMVSSSVKSMKAKIRKGVDLKNVWSSFEAYLKEFNSHRIFYSLRKHHIINETEVRK